MYINIYKYEYLQFGYKHMNNFIKERVYILYIHQISQNVQLAVCLFVEADWNFEVHILI